MSRRHKNWRFSNQLKYMFRIFTPIYRVTTNHSLRLANDQSYTSLSLGEKHQAKVSKNSQKVPKTNKKPLDELVDNFIGCEGWI